MKGKSQPDVTWTFESTDSPEKNPSILTQTVMSDLGGSTSTYMSVFHLVDVEKSHEGNYQCMTGNAMEETKMVEYHLSITCK